MTVRVEFKPQDCWIGLYWKTEWGFWHHSGIKEKRIDAWICLLPMLPIHCIWYRLEPLPRG